jgi:hypothetical protein
LLSWSFFSLPYLEAFVKRFFPFFSDFFKEVRAVQFVRTSRCVPLLTLLLYHTLG